MFTVTGLQNTITCITSDVSINKGLCKDATVFSSDCIGILYGNKERITCARIALINRAQRMGV